MEAGEGAPGPPIGTFTGGPPAEAAPEEAPPPADLPAAASAAPAAAPPPLSFAAAPAAAPAQEAAPAERTEGAGERRWNAGHDHEVSPRELTKWSEMVQFGVTRYMDVHPDRFRRRVRRGVPQRFRWLVWKAAVSRGTFDRDLPRVSSSYHSLRDVRNSSTSQIEIDIRRTFPEERSFDAEQQQRLFRVLNAYAGHNPDVGYCQGMNYIAGLLLIVSGSEEESFGVLCSLMDDPQYGLVGFYKEGLPLLKRYLRACDKLVLETVPQLREHFMKEGLRPAMYLHQWFLSVFINSFPLSMVMIIWDVIVTEGLPVILRIAVSILQVLKDSLLEMSLEDMAKFFKMMKSYETEDEELKSFRIGQLLMQHTVHVQIPEYIMEYLRSDLDSEDLERADINLEYWENDLSGGSWLQSFTRLFWSKGSNRKVAGPAAHTRPAPLQEPGGSAAAGGSLAPAGATSALEIGRREPGGSSDRPEEAEDSAWQFL